MKTDRYVAPGLPADWLNAWLAAVGVTVLVPDMRLSWTDDDPARAEFAFDGTDVLGAIVEAFPSRDWIDDLPIALTQSESATKAPRNVPLDSYADRARLARRRNDLSLAAGMTDLVLDVERGVANSRFNPAVPKGITLWQRLSSSREAALALDDDLRRTVGATLEGRARRVRGNGLGFDYRRITVASAAGGSDPMVDPVVETLAFVGSTIFPARGAGEKAPSLRGWTKPRKGAAKFVWPVWSQPLDCWAIDALVDLLPQDGEPTGEPALARLGLRSVYESVSYQPSGSSDATRGFGSRRRQ